MGCEEHVPVQRGMPPRGKRLRMLGLRQLATRVSNLAGRQGVFQPGSRNINSHRLFRRNSCDASDLAFCGFFRRLSSIRVLFRSSASAMTLAMTLVPKDFPRFLGGNLPSALERVPRGGIKLRSSSGPRPSGETCPRDDHAVTLRHGCRMLRRASDGCTEVTCPELLPNWKNKSDR